MFKVENASPEPPPGVRGILRARAGNALVNAIRDVDLVTELDPGRFLVLLPYTDRLVGAEVARRIIGAVAAADPVIAAGRTVSPKVIGAIAGMRPGEPLAFERLMHDAAQLLEQAAVTGASLAVEP
jgi:PleD family two-component response regulator